MFLPASETYLLFLSALSHMYILLLYFLSHISLLFDQVSNITYFKDTLFWLIRILSIYLHPLITPAITTLAMIPEIVASSAPGSVYLVFVTFAARK